MSMVHESSDNLFLFEKIQATVKAIKDHQQKVEQERQNTQFIQSLTSQNLKNKYEIEITQLREELNFKNQENYQLRTKLHELETEFGAGYKKQFRRLTESLVQKETEIQSLNKELVRKKNKILSLQADNQSIKTAKQNLQATIAKSLQMLKNQLKELKSECEQTQLDREIFDKKYRQTSDKLELVINLQTQIQNNRKFTEERIQKLRRQNAELSERNLQLQLEIEKLKQGSYKKTKKLQRQNVASVKSKQSVSKSQLLHVQPNNINFIHQVQNIINQLQNDNQHLQQIQKKIQNLEYTLNQQNQSIAELIQLKTQKKILMDELNSFKVDINPLYKQQLLSRDHPKIYDFFSEKMNQVQRFDSRLNKLQKNMRKAIQMIEQIAVKGIPSHSNENEIMEIERELRVRITKEIQNKINKQNQQTRSQLQEYYCEKINSLQGQIQRLKEQKSQLEKIVFLEKISQNIQTTQSLLANQEQEINTQTQCDNDQMNLIKSSKQKQIMSYLQQKSDKMEKEITILKQKIKDYKIEMAKAYLTDHKNFKDNNKIKRCYECYLKIEFDQSSHINGQICANCRKYFHLNQECNVQHQKNCKKEAPKKRATKRQSTRYSNDSQVSTPNSNYFY